MAGGGNDILSGGAGNDVMYAGNLPGGGTGATTDTLSGGGGDDVVVWTMDTWITTFDGGDGFDTADYGGYNPSAFFFSQPLTFQVNSGGEIEASAFIFQRGLPAYNQVIGSFANIERIITTLYGTVNLGSYTRDITIDGSAQIDRIATGSGRDIIHGGAGADIISSGGDNDIVQGGQGDDSMDGGAGLDTADYSDATAAVQVNLSPGRATGGAGNDTLSNFENVIGSAFNDTLIASIGGGSLSGGLGTDILSGGAGRDYFRFAPGDSISGSADNVTDFTTGVDYLVVGGMTTSYAIVRQGNGSVVFVSHPTGPQTVVTTNAAVSAGDLLHDIEFATIYVSATMVGLDGGADTLIGGRLADLIYGQGGDDVLIGGLGADALSGGAGADTFLYRSYTESVSTYLNPNQPIGSSGRDPGFDNLFDFESGIDRIDVTAVGLTSISIIRQDGSSFLFGSISGAVVPFQIVAAGRAINANDLIGYGGGVYMQGSGAADVLIGGAGADGIIGGDGADIILGGAGGDALGGGAGADIFRYLSTTDSNASAYDNLFDFQTGLDKIDLTGVPLMNSVSIIRQDGSSFVFMSTLQGATMQLVVAGRDINIGDFLGGSNSFYLQGSSAADVLNGATGGDTIVGGDGADIITGGGSSDTLYGGAGADIFRYSAASDSVYGGRGRDFIQDFVSGTDKVDLSLVRTSENDRMGIAYLNGNAHLFVDLGGDGFNDMEIIFTGATVLTSDIIWNQAAGAALEDAGKSFLPDVYPVENSGDGLAHGHAGLFGNTAFTLDENAIIGGYQHHEGWALYA